MKFNTKTRYALRAMVEIAKADPKTKVYQKDIAESQKISLKYLDQIIQSLKIAGLIVNLKGRKSGYCLTKDASQIKVIDIHLAFEKEVAIIDCLSEYFQCELIDICATNPFWTGLNDIIKQYLSKITLQDLVNGESNTFNASLKFE